MFPAHPREQIEQIYNEFPPDSLSDVAACLANTPASDPALPDDVRTLHEMFPDMPTDDLAELLHEHGGDVEATANLLRLSLFRSSSRGVEVAPRNRVTYRSFLEIDMHGADYKKDEWITVIRLAVDDAMAFGVDEIRFIPGQGIHSMDQRPVLRPLTMATLMRLGLGPVIDQDNPGLVRCSMSSVVPDDADDGDPTIAMLRRRFAEFPVAACRALVVFTGRDSDAAWKLARRVEAGLARSAADVAPEAERRRLVEQQRVVNALQEEFSHIPPGIVRRQVIDAGYDRRASVERLRDIQRLIARVDRESLCDVFEDVPNLPIEQIVDALERNGNNPDRTIEMLLTQSANGLANAEGIFGCRLDLKGKRRNGQNRHRPIVELDITGTDMERAERNIRRVVQRIVDTRHIEGELRIRTSWLNPRGMTADWVMELVQEVGHGLRPMATENIVSIEFYKG
jgi:hypothetical protein